MSNPSCYDSRMKLIVVPLTGAQSLACSGHGAIRPNFSNSIEPIPARLRNHNIHTPYEYSLSSSTGSPLPQITSPQQAPSSLNPSTVPCSKSSLPASNPISTPAAFSPVPRPFRCPLPSGNHPAPLAFLLVATPPCFAHRRPRGNR